MSESPASASSGAAASRSAPLASFEFHRSLERPGQFLRREWRWALLFGGGFTLVFLGLLFGIDAAFFYPRVETDQLRYLLKAKAFVETGTTVAREAVNSPPFLYAAAPGLLRAPFLVVFGDFDDQLRAIQIMNLVIAATTALMSAYMLSWALPRHLHRWAIAFSFGFIAFSPDWLTNIFVPLADAPYAALSLGCVILAVQIVATPKRIGDRRGAIILFTALLIVGFFVRYTAPVILVFAAALAWGRWGTSELPRRTAAILAIAAVALVATFALINADTLAGKYAVEALDFVEHAEKGPVALHLAASAIPAQIVPVFNLGFQVPPLSGRQRAPIFAATPRDAAWMIAGLLITALMVHGMIASRKRFLPEILYFLAPLALLAVITSSTTRYLMSYQPIIWLGFFTGLAAVTRRWRARTSPQVMRIAVAVFAIACAAGIFAMRSARASRTAGADSSGSALIRARNYVGDVGTTFRTLREFLESRRGANTLLIGSAGEVGRFTLISDLPYYIPDANLGPIVRDREVYAVLACGSAPACQGFDRGIARQSRRIARYGDYRYETAFARDTPNARALVRRVLPAD